MNNTLLLNAGFEPLRVISWQRAFILLFQGKVEVLEEYQGSFIHTVALAYRVPAVVRLRRWVTLKYRPTVIRFSRANVYARDEHRCQYCYRKYPEGELTLDHVFPAVRGGKKTWVNIVTACMKCNQKKGNKTPEEAGLILFKKPDTPNWIPGILFSAKISTAPVLWMPYLQSEQKSEKLNAD